MCLDFHGPYRSNYLTNPLYISVNVMKIINIAIIFSFDTVVFFYTLWYSNCGLGSQPETDEQKRCMNEIISNIREQSR